MDITVLVDIDMLFDTRVALASEIFGMDIKDLIPNPEYRNRMTDASIARLCGVTDEEWAEKWAVRGTLDLLASSVITNMALALPKLIGSSLKTPGDWDIVGNVNVIVNTWPYSLSAEVGKEIASMLKSNPLITYPVIFKVTCENIPYLSQTSSYIDMRHIDALYIYDYIAWSLLRHEEWKDIKKTHHHIGIVTPQLATSKILDDDLKYKPHDIFEKSELYHRLTGIANITYIDTEYVCALWNSPSSR